MPSHTKQNKQEMVLNWQKAAGSSIEVRLAKPAKEIQTNCLSGDTALNSLEQLEAAEEQSGRCRAARTETIQRRFRVCQVMQRAKAGMLYYSITNCHKKGAQDQSKDHL